MHLHRYLFLLAATLLSAVVRADAIDSLIQSFDRSPSVETANRFLDILHRGGLVAEPVTFSRSIHPDSLKMQMWYWATEYYHAIQQYENAVEYAQQALPLCKSGGDRGIEGDLLNLLSICYVRKGDFRNAAVYAKQCNALDMKQGDPDCISSSLNTLAGIYMSSHQPKEAEKYILQALKYAQKADNPARLAVINGTASEVYKNLRNDTLALKYGLRAYEIEKQIGRPDKAAMRQTLIASALVGLQRPTEAKEVLLQAIPELRKAQNFHSLGIACNHMGLLLIQEHNETEAVSYFQEALKIFLEQGDIYNEALCRRGLYQALRDSNPQEAMQHNDRYNELRDSLYDKDTGELLSRFAAEYGNEELLLANENMQKAQRIVLGIMAIVSILAVIAVWAYIAVRNRRQQQRASHLLNRIDKVTRQYEVMRMGGTEVGERDNTEDPETEGIQSSVFNEEDRKFVLQFVKAVDQCIENQECNVEAIATAMCMSQATMRRRVFETTAETPKVVISAIQMQKACVLLKQSPELPINEVALRCGYGETANFSRSFKRTFGVSPSQFGKNKSND